VSKSAGGHEDLAGGHGPLCPPPLGYGPGLIDEVAAQGRISDILILLHAPFINVRTYLLTWLRIIYIQGGPKK